MFTRTKSLYGLNYEQNAVRVKTYSFLCLIFKYIVTGENARGSTYGWVGRFTICMVPALYRLRGSQIAPYWRPRRTSKAPWSLSITGFKRKRVWFEWENFLMTMRRLLPHEVISTMNSESVWLAITEIIISRERSQHFLLKGRSSGIELMQMHVHVCKETTDSYSQRN